MNGSLTDGSRVRLAVSEAGFQTQSNPIKPYQRTRCRRHRQRQPGARGAQGGTQGRGSTRGITESQVRAGERLTTASRTVQPPQGWRAPAERAHADGKSKHFGSGTGQRPILEAAPGGTGDQRGGPGNRQPINSAASVYRGQAPQGWPKRRRQRVAANQPYT